METCLCAPSRWSIRYGGSGRASGDVGDPSITQSNCPKVSRVTVRREAPSNLRHYWWRIFCVRLMLLSVSKCQRSPITLVDGRKFVAAHAATIRVAARKAENRNIFRRARASRIAVCLPILVHLRSGVVFASKLSHRFASGVIAVFWCCGAPLHALGVGRMGGPVGEAKSR